MAIIIIIVFIVVKNLINCIFIICYFYYCYCNCYYYLINIIIIIAIIFIPIIINIVIFISPITNILVVDAAIVTINLALKGWLCQKILPRKRQTLNSRLTKIHPVIFDSQTIMNIIK